MFSLGNTLGVWDVDLLPVIVEQLEQTVCMIQGRKSSSTTVPPLTPLGLFLVLLFSRAI